MPAEIVVRGAGPVGCTIALLLHAAGRKVGLAGRKAFPGKAPLRPIALSHASRLILERIGAWRALDPTPIERIHVSQQGAFGRTCLSAGDAGVPALGYVVDYESLSGSLLSRLGDCGIRIETDAEGALLTVHAEGSSNVVQEKN